MHKFVLNAYENELICIGVLYKIRKLMLTVTAYVMKIHERTLLVPHNAVLEIEKILFEKGIFNTK